jgi:hypothetical protein
MGAVLTDSKRWQLSDDCRQGERDGQLLPQVLLVGKMADLFDQDPNDLEAAEYFWSVTEELV